MQPEGVFALATVFTSLAHARPVPLGADIGLGEHVVYRAAPLTAPPMRLPSHLNKRSSPCACTPALR
jgi:hypothetical protein